MRAKIKWFSNAGSGSLTAAFAAAGLNTSFRKWHRAPGGGRGLPAEVRLCCRAGLGRSRPPDWPFGHPF